MGKDVFLQVLYQRYFSVEKRLTTEQMNDIKINENSQEINDYFFSDFSDYPELEKFQNFLLKELKCESIEDLVLIDVHPDHEEVDEEGWEISSFFPQGIEIQREIIHDEMRGDKLLWVPKNFSLGIIERVIVKGILFFAEYDASPVGLWANHKILVQYES